ncbi:hypothetical protein COLO4_11880 [Corchorus olitorius]|uniref:Aldo/keto reductase n=1 Tax=Corchorus olitorius TaxID=93759 RepID=A0A1R3K2Y5_9ROSI|nr:hypothetical protein COLO4_11880 [Corchorus olitorius]
MEKDWKRRKTFTLDRVEDLAKKHRCTAAQLALAWLLHQVEWTMLCLFLVIKIGQALSF